MSAHTTVEEYLAGCDEIGRARLEAIRSIVREVAPESGERISYAIPAFTIDGKVFVFMAAWQEHVSMYPLPQGDAELDRALAPYAASKGTAKFLHRDPLPLDAVRLIVEAKLREAIERADIAAAKKAAKKTAKKTAATAATVAKEAAPRT
jgi:uncharacterized protein YdhG (YjbR/CyaY superfamily)